LMGRRIAHILQENGLMRPERVIIGALERETDPLECYVL
jgi:hypothetical protein